VNRCRDAGEYVAAAFGWRLFFRGADIWKRGKTYYSGFDTLEHHLDSHMKRWENKQNLPKYDRNHFFEDYREESETRKSLEGT